MSAITDVSLVVDRPGVGGLCHCRMSAACAVRSLRVRSSISACLRCARAMSRRSGSTTPETFYPLHVRLCDACLLVQLPAYVPGEDIFSDYAYFSSYSDSWVAHAKRYAETMIERLGLTRDSLVTEVASNDGYLLQHFQAAGIPVLGVEPARQRGRGGPGPGHPDGGPVPRRRHRPADRRRSTAGPTWWPRTTCSPTCPTSGVSRPGCARWSRTTAWSRWNSRTCSG